MPTFDRDQTPEQFTALQKILAKGAKAAGEDQIAAAHTLLANSAQANTEEEPKPHFVKRMEEPTARSR